MFIIFISTTDMCNKMSSKKEKKHFTKCLLASVILVLLSLSHNYFVNMYIMNVSFVNIQL